MERIRREQVRAEDKIKREKKNSLQKGKKTKMEMQQSRHREHVGTIGIKKKKKGDKDTENTN